MLGTPQDCMDLRLLQSCVCFCACLIQRVPPGTPRTPVHHMYDCFECTHISISLRLPRNPQKSFSRQSMFFWVAMFYHCTPRAMVCCCRWGDGGVLDFSCKLWVSVSVSVSDWVSLSVFVLVGAPISSWLRRSPTRFRSTW